MKKKYLTNGEGLEALSIIHIIGDFEIRLLKSFVPVAQPLTEGAHISCSARKRAVQTLRSTSSSSINFVVLGQFNHIVERRLVLRFIPCGLYVLVK